MIGALAAVRPFRHGPQCSADSGPAGAKLRRLLSVLAERLGIMPLIEVAGLTKEFRRPVKDPGLRGAVKHLFTRNFTTHVAVDHVDLSIEAGEAVAYVGPNGAGKSTTIKMLTGILVPTSGTVHVGGLVPSARRIDNARQIGVVFGQRTQLWWDLPVRESLGLIRDIYGIGATQFAATLERFDDVLGIGELMPIMARKLSLGQRMRADLAAALLHAPRIVYLDEPTIGLDIAVKDKVRGFVRSLVDDGVTVMLTTHDLGDIEDICRRIVIIDEGRMIYDGGLDTVKDTFARDRTIRFTSRASAPLAAIQARLPAVRVLAGDGPRDFAVQFDRFALAAGEVLTEVLAVVDVIDIEIDEPAIEDVIRKVYAGELELPPVGLQP
ncbi:MAG: ATP-binding cassette domain-containing protein, partial [Actinomycetota bacterium]